MEQAERGRSNHFARELFKPLPERYDLLGEILSFGQNGRWRRRMVSQALVDEPGRVLDVATGTAGVAIELGRRSPAEIVGLDLTPEMLARGRDNVRAAGMSTRIRLLAGRGEQLPFEDGIFDAVAFTYLLRYVDDPGATLAEMARVLKPGGRMACLEFFVPPNRALRALWHVYTRAVLPLAGLVTGGRAWFDVGRFLGPSISTHYRRYPLAAHLELWRGVGMADVGYSIMSAGGGLVMWGTKADG